MTGGDPSCVAGVDGARGGWVTVVLRGRSATCAVYPDFAAVRSAVDAIGATVVAVDMPLGLADGQARPVDGQVRSRLGARRSTFFPTPARAVLDAASHPEANQLSRASIGAGISIQAWNLVPRIREVRAAVGPDDTERFVECHPETTYATLAGSPLESKKTDAGCRERLAVLGRLIDDVDSLIASRSGCGIDDILDAAVAAVTAQRHAMGVAEVLGDGVDADGYPLRIVI